jgi:DNA-binding MarR family transcriptional regulator
MRDGGFFTSNSSIRGNQMRSIVVFSRVESMTINGPVINVFREMLATRGINKSNSNRKMGGFEKNGLFKKFP